MKTQLDLSRKYTGQASEASQLGGNKSQRMTWDATQRAVAAIRQGGACYPSEAGRGAEIYPKECRGREEASNSRQRAQGVALDVFGMDMNRSFSTTPKVSKKGESDQHNKKGNEADSSFYKKKVSFVLSSFAEPLTDKKGFDQEIDFSADSFNIGGPPRGGYFPDEEESIEVGEFKNEEDSSFLSEDSLAVSASPDPYFPHFEF